MRDTKARALVRMYRLMSRPKGARRGELIVALEVDDRTLRRYLADLRTMPEFLVRAEASHTAHARFWIQERLNYHAED